MSENLPLLTQYYSVSTSPENFEGSDNVLLYNSNPTKRLINSSTAGHWLQSCSNVEEIRKIHAVVVKLVKDPLPFVYNNMISKYVKFGDLVAARRVFDNMSERNVVSWTAMLNGYQRHGIGNEALRLFIEFVNNGFHGNAHTYVCMLNLYSKTFDYELGRQLHACIIKSQVSNSILDCAILHFYARCADLDSAFDVFDRMQKRDLICWTTMITACSQHRRGQEAFILLSQMLSDGLDPNEFTVCSILNACGEEKELRFGKQLHGTVVKKAYDRDVYVGTALVDLYAKCGKIEESRRIFDGMERKNAITWNSIIAGYACNGLGGEAISLFRIMKRLKVLANNLTMVSVLRACGLLRELSIGSQYLPNKDVISWTTMISGCAHLGHEYEAIGYLKEMLGEGVEPNPFTYSSALKACAKLENIKQGKLIHSSLNKTLAWSNVFVGSALVHMYSKCGHLSEAVQVFDSMPERNLVSWTAMIVAYAKMGFVTMGDAVLADSFTSADVLVQIKLDARPAKMNVMAKAFVIVIWVNAAAFMDSVFIPVDRKWEVDESAMGQMLYIYQPPRSIVFWYFPEGTDTTKKKCTKSQKYAEENGLPLPTNVLLPKTRGFYACLEILRGFFAAGEIPASEVHDAFHFFDNLLFQWKIHKANRRKFKCWNSCSFQAYLGPTLALPDLM
ncbi:hypothetical protein DH2020_014762 [Rehmannia glutinosa]|uniref:Pentatricopeptide repeat-containing protein n=1 Tax=Rehmannia glutinosa TaxID=99300 RepID=A0ABR0X0H8_REHGL